MSLGSCWKILNSIQSRKSCRCVPHSVTVYMYIVHICVSPLQCMGRSSFSEFAQRHGKDERFKAVEKMREREQLFSDYLQELKKVGKHKEKADGTTHTSATKNKTDKVRSVIISVCSV